MQKYSNFQWFLYDFENALFFGLPDDRLRDPTILSERASRQSKRPPKRSNRTPRWPNESPMMAQVAPKTPSEAFQSVAWSFRGDRNWKQ
eukprot:1177875-Pyramimonas_sp.AAC.1